MFILLWLLSLSLVGCGPGTGSGGPRSTDAGASEVGAAAAGTTGSGDVLPREAGSRSQESVAKSRPPVVEDDADVAALVEALDSVYLSVRLEAIEGLGKLALAAGSPDAVTVVQRLLDHRRIEFNDYEDGYVEAALRQLGTVTVAEVSRQALSAETPEVSNACEAMRSLGGAFFTELQPSLAAMLKNDDFSARWGALYALETMGPAGEALIPQVTPYLQDEDFQLQIIALRALAGIGPVAGQPWETVRDLTSSGQNVSVKSHALRTLGYISVGDETRAAAAAKVLGESLVAFPFATKSRALEGLLVLRQQAAPAAEAVAKLLFDQTGLAPKASVVQGYITDAWERPVELLVSLIKDPVVGMECQELLRDLGPRARASAPVLLQMLVEPQEDDAVVLLAAEGLVAQVGLATAEDLAGLDEAGRQHLQTVAAALEKLAAAGESESHHFAGLTLQRWRAWGWTPAAGDSQTVAPPPAAGATAATER